MNKEQYQMVVTTFYTDTRDHGQFDPIKTREPARCLES